MKEFLEPLPNGDFRYHKDSGDMIGGDWIEIPEGADILIKFGYRGSSEFYSKGFKYCFCDGDWGETIYNDENLEYWRSCPVLWQRDKVEVEVEKFDTDEMLADVEVQMATYSQHSHYFKDVRDLNVIDVYQVLKLFNVTDPCLQHIIKKALVAGGRGHKDFERDLKDIHDTSKRALEINNILH